MSVRICRFDVSHELREYCFNLPKQGEQAHRRFQTRIAEEGTDRLWLIDLTTAQLINYEFVACFLPSFVHEYGMGLPENSAIAVRGKLVIDRMQVLKGLARETGDIGPLDPSTELQRIAEKRRSLFLVSEPASGDPQYEYLGLKMDGSEENLWEVMRFADQQPFLTLDSIRSGAGFGGIEAAKIIAELEARRFILKVDEDGKDPIYRSVFQVLHREGAL
ncbi:MAG: hypothetical protein AB1941_04030 [Gemmatimonadota bacterium]